MNGIFEAVGGRKFLLSLLVMGVGTFVQIKSPNGVNESYVALLVGILATFGAANAYVSAKTASGAEQAPPEPQQDLMPHLEETAQRISSIESALQEVAKNSDKAAKLAVAALELNTQKRP